MKKDWRHRELNPHPSLARAITQEFTKWAEHSAWQSDVYYWLREEQSVMTIVSPSEFNGLSRFIIIIPELFLKTDTPKYADVHHWRIFGNSASWS